MNVHFVVRVEEVLDSGSVLLLLLALDHLVKLFMIVRHCMLCRHVCNWDLLVR